MKLFDLKKEIWLWLIMASPLVFLYSVWSELPATVATHFNFNGEPDDWSSKSTLAVIMAALSLGIYLLITFIPLIDPKKKVLEMGNKYFLVKLFTTLFISILCMFIVQSAKTSSMGEGKMIFVITGAFFAVLGNYMPAMKPNYFIGIRTPWTLENETVWRKTHQLSGKLLFIAGIINMILPFLIPGNFMPVFMGISIGVPLVAVVYSYIVYKQVTADVVK